SYLASDAWVDITFPHVIPITGTRGSGKSFDLGVILEGVSVLAKPSAIQNEDEPQTSILIDTQSQSCTLRFEPNPEIAASKRHLGEFAKWSLKPNSLANTRVFVPPSSNKFLGDEIEFRIKPSDLTHSEWCALIGQEVYSPQGHIIAETLRALAGR